MRNYKSIIHPVTAIALVFCLTAFHGLGCTNKEEVPKCYICTATNSYGNMLEEKKVCTPQEEQDFRAHYAMAQTPVTVNCR